MSKAWHKEALRLHFEENLSWRKIAKRIGVPRSTVSDYLRVATKEDYLDDISTKPKILLFDIETSKILAYVWGLFKQNISINAIKEDWYVICWSAKWYGEDEIMNASVHHFDPLEEVARYKFNEHHVVEALWSLLDEADVIVAYNGKSFDRKKMNAKFLEYGLPEPSPYKIVDPYLICKGNFALTSNKMDYVSRLVTDNEQGKHATNELLWHNAMEDDVEALDYMQDYCDQDIHVLEVVYDAVKGWDKNAPNLALYYSDDVPRCNACGSTDLKPIENSYATTGVSKFPVVRCGCCDKILRDRKTVLTKEKRESLFMNVR